MNDLKVYENLKLPNYAYEEAKESGSVYNVNYSVCKDKYGKDPFWKAVKYFVESDLGNEFFLRQFEPPYLKPFVQKKYWHGAAVVLVSRGIKRVEDVKTRMLCFLQSRLNPGVEVIVPFIIKNKKEFLNNFYEAIWFAADDDDIGYL